MTAGRGSGKTELAKRRLIRFLPVRKKWTNPIYAYCSPTYNQAKRIAWRHFKELTPKEWLLPPPKGISEGDLIIRTVFGSELHVIGLDKPHRIEGNQWDGIVVDESSDQRPGHFELSIRPALTHKDGWCWRIGVPKRQGAGAREYRQSFEAGLRGDDPDMVSYTWPSWDILPAEEIEALRRQLDEKDFNEQIGGCWESAGGACFYSYSEKDNVRPCTYYRDKLIVVGSDFNVNPMAWVLCHAYPEEKRLEVFDELWLRDTNTRATLDVLWNRYGSHRGGWVFIGDAAGAARHTSASFSDYLHIKNDKRFQGKVRYPSKNPRVTDRLSETNSLLCNAAGQRRLHIDPRCQHLKDDLEFRALKDDGMPDDSDPDAGHISDALGYVVHSLYPLHNIGDAATSIRIMA